MFHPQSAGRRRRTAFTLIELLVVIAIISILASILMPAFAQAREKARQTACMSNMKQLTTAFMMYAQDYDEGFPGSGDFTKAPQAGVCQNDATNISGAWVVRQEITKDTYACDRSKQPVPNGSLYSYVKNTQVYICTSDGGGQDKTLSYAMNSNLSGQGLPQLQAPSNCVLLVDEGTNQRYLSNLDDGNFQAPIGPTNTGASDVFLGSPDGKANVPSRVHNGGANFAYGDGHVKWHKPEQMKIAAFDPSAS
jgi:prepilin-type N-terminal cleavage/methylation domain-containing protein/prepilin-type processing-associated H-X9-DG protein